MRKPTGRILYDYERIARNDAIDVIEGLIDTLGDRLQMEMDFDPSTAVRYFLRWLEQDGADVIRNACTEVYATGQEEGYDDARGEQRDEDIVKMEIRARNRKAAV